MTISTANQWSAEFTRHVLVTVWLAWNLDRSGTKKISGTRYSTQWKPPKSEPYRAVPCSGKAPLHSDFAAVGTNYWFIWPEGNYPPPTEPGFSQGFFSILSPMEFWFLGVFASGLLSWGHFISSKINDLIAQILFKLNWAGRWHHWIQ